MEKIYKSCTPGMSNEQFRINHTNGLTTFVSYERLLREGLYEAIGFKKDTERMVGMVMDQSGIQVYIEKI